MAKMNLICIEPADKRRINQFINLPFHLYSNNKYWVPPFILEVQTALNPRKHPFYQHGSAIFLLALDEKDHPIGRLAVLDNSTYNTYNHEKIAFFCMFECIDDLNPADELFKAGFDWARSRGLEKIIGPKGFTALDGLGLLVKGFELRPALGQAYNPPYYDRLLLEMGFVTDRELVSGHLHRDMQFPEKIVRAAGLVHKRYGIYAKRFHSRKELLDMLPSLLNLYNRSITPGSGNTPLSEQDLKKMTDQLLLFADPQLIKVIMKDDQLIGFLLTYPDISTAIQRCKGRLLPFGWLGLLLESRRTDWLNINGAAILEEYQGMGGTAILFNELYKSVIDRHYHHAELVQIGVENNRMQNELQSLGVDFYKMHRTYKKNLC